MAINRFNRPVNNQLISQFVPQDLNMIAKVLASKQQRYDTEQAKAELIQDKLSSLTGVGEADIGIIKEQGQKMDALAQEFSNQDLSDTRIARQFRTQAKALFNDPMIRNTQMSVRAMAEYKDALTKIKDYRPENDTFAQQVQQYKQSGGAVNGPLSFSRIQEGVDERKTAETFFDNLTTSGRSTWTRVGDTVKKVGWEGIRQGQVDTQLAQSIDDYAGTPAGQQALRRFRMLKANGQVSPEASAGQYIAGILASAGNERVGEKRIGGAGGGFTPDGFGGFSSDSNVQVNVPFVTKSSKAVESAKLEDGQLIGSGKSSWWDVIKGDVSFSEKWNDVSITQEDKENMLPLFVLTNELNLSKEAGLNRINETRAPVKQSIQGKRQTDVSNAYFNKAAGNYLSMTVYTQEGEIISGREFFEREGLLDSEGNWDSDVKNKVQIDGIHKPESGYFAKGLHMSTKGGSYLVETPTTNNPEDIAAKKAFIAAEVQATGVTHVIDGMIYYYDENAPNKISAIDVHSTEGKKRINAYK